MLEGPPAVIQRAKELLEADRVGLNSPIVELMNKIDRRSVVQGVLRRFWASQSRDGDYTTLLRYGNRMVYREMARRFEQTGKLDPGAWDHGEQAQWAVTYGRNWAIPIAARMFRETAMTGSRGTSDGKGSQPFSAADVAMGAFGNLVGRDFGYRRNASVEDRLAAIDKARQWWEKNGRDELKEKIGADHPPANPVGNLLASEAEIAHCVAAIEGSNQSVRTKVFGELNVVFSWHVQEALTTALARSGGAGEKLLILRIVQRNPALWMLPVLSSLFQHDKDLPVRLLAGQILRDVVTDRTTHNWLETRDAALSAARRVVHDANQPVEVRREAASILEAWGWWDDLRLIQSPAVAPSPAPKTRDPRPVSRGLR